MHSNNNMQATIFNWLKQTSLSDRNEMRSRRAASAPAFYSPSWHCADPVHSHAAQTSYALIMPDPNQHALCPAPSSRPIAPASLSSLEAATRDSGELTYESNIDADAASARFSITPLSSPCLTDVSSMPSEVYEARDYAAEIQELKAKLAARQEYLALHPEEALTYKPSNAASSETLPSVPARADSCTSKADPHWGGDTRDMSRDDMLNLAHPASTFRFLTDLFALIDRCMAQAEADAEAEAQQDSEAHELKTSANDNEDPEIMAAQEMSVDEYMLQHSADQDAMVPGHLVRLILARDRDQARAFTAVPPRACWFDAVLAEQRCGEAAASGQLEDGSDSRSTRSGETFSFGKCVGNRVVDEGGIDPLDCA